ncbi:MAG TPA: DUF4142 domain-containing protein [Gemmatimonadaceae bacterium]|nr:DUF4142 domain-containing protein [Gemmatimonadaceae bacterium]
MYPRNLSHARRGLCSSLAAAALLAACASGRTTTTSSTGEVDVARAPADTTGRVTPASGSISPSAKPPTLGAGVTGAPQPGSPAVATRDSVPGAAAGAAGAPTGAMAGAAGAAGAAANAPTLSLKSDANIVASLHESNLGEINAGQLAQQRAQSSAVKSFAQQMVTDHTTLDTRGSALAASARITPALPDSTLPKSNAQDLSTLQGATAGTAFDRAYVGQQVAAHQRTLALVEASIGLARNAALKQMLQSEVRPRVAAHLQMAQDLQRTVGTAP